MSEQVRYQTYKSKSKSHIPSNSHLIPNTSLSTLPTENHKNVVWNTDKDTQQLSPPAPIFQITNPDQEIPAGSSEGSTSSKSSLTVSDPDTAQASPSTASSFAGPSSSQSDEKQSPSVSVPTKKASTFRRVPRRDARLSHPPSPLGPNHKLPAHSPSVSVSSSIQGIPTPQEPVMRASSPNVEPQLSPTSFVPRSKANSIVSPSSPTTESSNGRLSPIVPASSASTPASRPNEPAQSVSITRPSTASMNGSQSPAQHTQAPYRPGFQPKGVIRSLTDDFLASRHVQRDGGGIGKYDSGMKRVERTKLTRRLEKLIDLHFPQSASDRLLTGSVEQRPGLGVLRGSENHRRASSLFDFDIKKANVSDPGSLLRALLGSNDVNTIRAAEQRITPWQDDADVARCPLCLTSFHPLTNRKHHCRLCGQIVCSLPVKGPHRPMACSLLFVIDPKTRRIEEVNEGVDYGVRKRAVGNGGTPSHGKGVNTDEDKFLKGVRICRACRPILLRQRYQLDIIHVPMISRLYEAFIGLENEIEEFLPQFQELVLSLSHNDQPTKDAAAARKRLIEAFTEYDTLSKRIRKLPCSSGGSQERVQIAILTRANLFLQKNMFPLQSLPLPPKVTLQGPKASEHPNDPSHHVDSDSKIALALQPLLEQEALLETFVEEAKAHRKFEDVKTLKANLGEIRAEIERIVTNGENGLLKNTNIP